MEQTENKLKIAMLGQKTVPSRDGGVEVVIEALSSELVKLGNDVTLFNRKRKPRNGEKPLTEYKGFKIKQVYTINRRSLDAFVYSYFATKKIKKLAAKGEFDVLHFHAEGPCAFLHKLPPKEKRNYKIVVTIHGLDWQRGKWKGIGSKVLHYCEKQAVKYADEIIVLSESMQNYFKANYGRETVFIPNGVNEPSVIKPDLIKSELGLEKDKYLLCVARIVPEKGLLTLIEGWKKVGDSTGKKLVIVGGESHAKDYYEKVVDACSGDDSIILTGFLSGEILHELFSNAYLYIQPSELEGMSMALLEARAYGNRCLVSDIPENVSVIGEDDFSFKTGDANALAEKIKEAIGADFETHVKKYKIQTWQDVAEKTQALYNGEIK